MLKPANSFVTELSSDTESTETNATTPLVVTTVPQRTPRVQSGRHEVTPIVGSSYTLFFARLLGVFY